MLAPSLAKFGPLGVKEFEVFDLPFIFKDTPSFRAVTEGPVGQALFKKLEPKGIKGLAYWDNGFDIMSANKPLHHVADFKGLKMRIRAPKVLDANMRSLGAIPQVMAFSELYQGLQSGVVDGTENTPSKRLHAEGPRGAKAHHRVQPRPHLVRGDRQQEFWEGLPADIRTTLEGAMKDATTYANAIAETENAQAMDKIRASGKSTVYTLTTAETEEWRKAMFTVHKEMEERVGKDTNHGGLQGVRLRAAEVSWVGAHGPCGRAAQASRYQSASVARSLSQPDMEATSFLPRPVTFLRNISGTR